jgi:hypothetical protein
VSSRHRLTRNNVSSPAKTIIENNRNMSILENILNNTVVENIKKIFLPAVIIIFISSSMLLFLPESFIERLYMEEFKELSKKWLGISWVISFVAIPVILLVILLPRIMKCLRIKNHIKNFDIHEIALVSLFISPKINTIKIPMNFSVASGLVKKGILEHSGGYDVHEFSSKPINHIITQTVNKYLTEKWLESTKNKMDKRDRELFEKDRVEIGRKVFF